MKVFSVPKPCHENWDKMNPDGKGRFCASCAKSVIDFTRKNNNEIFEIYLKQNQEVCGRFTGNQLQQNTHLKNRTLKFNHFMETCFSRTGIVLSTISVFITLLSCKNDKSRKIAADTEESDLVNCTDNTANSIVMGKMIAPPHDSARYKLQDLDSAIIVNDKNSEK